MQLLDAILQDRPEDALPHLLDWGVQHPERAILNLRRVLSELTPPEFGELFAFLEESIPDCFDSDRTLNNLERYQQISAGALQPHPLSRDRPFLFRLLLDLFGFSQFLTDVLIRYPHYVAWLGDPQVLEDDPPLAALEENLERSMAPFESAEKRQHAATRWLRRELLRAGARVMTGRSDEPGFADELSRSAIAVIRRAVHEARRPLVARFGVPLVETGEPGVAPVEATFCVVAMGKLGGMELNFSSDVDLIFIYSDEGQTRGVSSFGSVTVQGRISNHEFFRRLSESVMRFLTEPTEEGYLYRVDTRLRPDGAEGPLARSIGAFEIYHESSARPWERMALIKSRAIAGDPGLCRQFDDLSRGLAFGRASGPEIIEQVRDLKHRIDAEVDAGDEAGREIKRGRGGIREIEFYVQTLQLLHGARQPDLQTRSTLAAIPRLAERDHLSIDEAGQMSRDYMFLRRIEHRLQMMDLRQTHTLPDNEMEIELLARRCGLDAEGNLSAGARLMHAWESIAARVHDRFTGFFGRFGDESGSNSADAMSCLADRIGAGAPDRELIPLLASYGLESSSAISALRRMGGRGRSMYLSARALELFPKLLPALVEKASRTPRPVASIVHLDHLVGSYGSYASLYEVFLANPRLLEIMLDAFGLAGSWAQTLAAHPEYLDTLIDSGVLSEQIDEASIAGRLNEWLESLRPGDGDALAAVLSRFRRFESLSIGLAETARLIEFPEVTSRLTLTADSVVRAALSQTARNGMSSGEGSGFAVLAMGKQGSRELNYFSDLDLVFVWGGEQVPLQSEAAAEWAGDVTALLTRPTPEGVPYRIDARLRPEGASAPLAPSLSRYRDYYSGRAEIWEMQSFMKIRPVAGDRKLGGEMVEEISAIIAARLLAEYDDAALAEAVVSMRRRIEASVKAPSWVLCDFKKGPGGVVDLEFLAQYFQLLALTGGFSLVGKRPPEVFAWAAAEGRITNEEAEELTRHYDFLRRLESLSRLLFETESSRAPAGGEKAEWLGRALGIYLPGIGPDWPDHLLRVMRDTRSRFDRLLIRGAR